MNPSIPAARPGLLAIALAAVAAILVAACATGSSAERRPVPAGVASPPPSDVPAIPAGSTTDRGRRTLLPSPIGQLAPEDAPGAAPGGR